ncbi:MAG TPA: malto-oligosyltrehalose trehalohydrolase [Acidobacteriaceae bacterium]|jgi:maltooligosyltrehalose trehalohydrolase|nr:malto-oligosyltrehalose trehalohydrolase [Acidobacteriaceae bacterium]
MHRFRLWAPNAKHVRVQVDGTPFPLQPDAGGWWLATVEAAHPGSDYAFLLDDENLALPDPRSPWQPRGIHRPSRLLDHGAFHWTDHAWQPPPLPTAVMYEVHTGTFTPEGTFDAARAKLDALRDLGITHVELMPVNTFPGVRGWGYDGVDLFAPHEPYGGPDALKRFVEACHAKGLAVLLDVVYNHLGPDGNYLAKFGPYFTAAHHTPWGDAVNLEDRGSAEVRRFFCDNALMWLRDYHFDGLRLDAVHAYTDRSAIHFMEQLAAEVHALEAAAGRPYIVIAESDLNDPRLVMPRDAGAPRAPAVPTVGPPGLGYGLDAQWSDDFHHALVTVLTGERAGYYADFGSLADLAKSLRDVYVYDGRYSAHRDRIHGRPVPQLPGWRFLGYAQNHDQVGNRAKGERLADLTSFGRAQIAAALVLTSPFVPMIFQGEEWAASSPFQFFTNHNEELGKLVSAGRKKEFAAFGWDPAQVPDPQSPATFERSKLNWDERTHPPHTAMLDWYRGLIAFRRATPALTSGDLSQVHIHSSEEERWLLMERGPLTIAFSLAQKSIQLPIRPNSTLALASSPEIRLGGESLTLPPDSIAVLISE